MSCDTPEYIIFLDIDGVLCLAGAGLYQLPGRKKFEENAVKSLLSLCETFPLAKLVIISSWRQKKSSMKELGEKLVGLGFKSDTIYGSTPVINRNKRDEEIACFLESCPTLKHFTILDDSDEKFNGSAAKRLRPHLTLIDSSKGLTQSDVLRAKKQLEKEFKVRK
mmetsp:Transcript_9617/g.14485  ORF Transcript_9617/g.14485 Transcript_9617/m.14485 type:complete len:165 (-) Transcript_9617:21-515(-)